MQENLGCFDDARWALFWSADVLRRRYLPKISAFWRESGEEGVTELEGRCRGSAGQHGDDSGEPCGQRYYWETTPGVTARALAAQQAAAAKSFSSSISADATRQASLLDYYQKTLPSSGYSVFDTALQRGAGSGVAGGVFGLTTGLLGSLFKR